MDVVGRPAAEGSLASSRETAGSSDHAVVACQTSDGVARLLSLRITDETGATPERIFQGDVVRFEYEFELLSGVPASAGVDLADRVFCPSLTIRGGAGDQVVYCRDAMQHGVPAGPGLTAGQRVRAEQTVTLDVHPGTYDVSVGLFSVPENVWERYVRRDINHFEYHTHQRVHVSADGMPVSVDFDRYGQLRHYGLANLPAQMRVAVREGWASQTGTTVRPAPPTTPTAPPPTVLHVTHWKAGSQWIHKILNAIAPERVIAPRSDMAQFLVKPLRAGGVYPTLYVTRSEYERVERVGDVRRVVVIRDLRDALVSGYFSLRGSHPVIGPEIASHRTRLKDGNVEEGLINLMDLWLPGCARIQATWLEAGEPVLKYEDLLADDVGILLPLLRDRLGFAEVPAGTLMAAIEAARFDRVTGGRPRGDEDVASHERKGIAGDWRNHFTPRVKRAFKLRYGALLIEAGYERDFDW